MTTTAQQQKSWYKLRGVEYSTDFNFFLEHQIGVGNTNIINYRFFSRLDGMYFDSKKTIFREYRPLTHDEIVDICYDIHKRLLAGEFGEGELID